MPSNENRLISEGLFEGILRRPATPTEIIVYAGMLEAGFAVSDIINLFLKSEEYRSFSKTKLFVPPGHFYSPIVNTDEAAKHLAKLKKSPASLFDIEINHRAMITLWEDIFPYIFNYPFSNEKREPYRYATDNYNYGFGDSVILFAFMRYFKPRQFIEIGSGWSSACALDTAEHFMDGQCKFTFIEPYPRLVRDLIEGADDQVEIFETGIQDMDLTVFERLEDGDFLFIDSTHIVRTGSDVCFEVFEILPRLRSGVIVHIHDMFWPFEYPRHWIIDENRSWNELYFIRAYLMNNDTWKIIYFNDYFSKTEVARLAKQCPKILENSGGGLWLRKS